MSEGKKRKLTYVFGMIHLLLCFVITILSSVLITTIYISFYEEEYQPKAFRGEENNILIPVLLLILLILMTAVIFFISKKGKVSILKILFYIALTLTSFYFFFPILAIFVPLADIFSLMIGFVLVTLVHFKPEWYVINTVGVITSASAATILGMSLSIIPILILLIVFAAYDFISVYHTKHMISLADIAIREKLPILFVSPKTEKYSYLKEEKIKLEHRESIMMGFGDAVFPSSLVVSLLVYSGPLQALGAMLGAITGFCVLLYFVEKIGAQPGLPFLNSFSILGMLIFHLISLHL